MAFALSLTTLFTYFGVWNNDFVDYDDNVYVFLNGHIVRGLDWETVKWAFTFTGVAHWVPLTWLSYALDSEIYGMNPGGFHITNLVFHAVNVVLLFLLLQRMTNSRWRSAGVAALFGIHPLHVQSVAWVAERKDVLSGFFFFLMLLAYVRYAEDRGQKTEDRGQRTEDGDRNTEVGGQRTEVRKRTAEFGIRGRPDEVSSDNRTAHRLPSSFFRPRSTVLWYFLALAFFALGLMSKSMLVTGPFVLLLLDYWPLKRLELFRPDTESPPVGLLSTLKHQLPTCWPLVREKAPFFVLAFVSSLITYLAGEQELRAIGAMPLDKRLANGAVAFVAYLRQTFWPADLAVFYPPRPLLLLSGEAIAAVGFLALLTVVALILIRKHPFVPIAWLWFVGMLIPVSGIVQIGEMVQADRYTYLPSVGLFILFVWGASGWVRASQLSRWGEIIAIAVAGAALVGLAVAAQRQVRVWRNTGTLFTEAARVTRDNYQALSSLADLDLKQGRTVKAIASLEQVLRFAPKYPRAEYLLGTALQMSGKMQAALPHLAVAVGPEVAVPAQARSVLSLLDAGQLAEAEATLEAVMRAMPGEPNTLLMKAALLREQGRLDEAKQLFANLISRQPRFVLDNPTMNLELAELYSLAGENRQAVGYYAKAIELAPNSTNVLNNLAWLLATDADSQVRDGKRAVELAQRACLLTEWRQPLLMGTLAAAYAEAGRFPEAVKMAERARAMALADKSEDIAKRNSELLGLYRQGKAYHEPANQPGTQ